MFATGMVVVVLMGGAVCGDLLLRWWDADNGPRIVAVPVSLKPVATLKPAIKAPSPASPLPAWIQAGIVRMHGVLDAERQDNMRLAKVNQKLAADLAAAQAKNGPAADQIARLRAENVSQGREIAVLRHRLDEANLRLQTRQLAPVAPAAIPRQGIVAIQPVPQQPAKPISGAMRPPEKGWMVIATEHDKAVLQAPDGEVSVVKVGGDLDGARITGIDAKTGTVILNGNQRVSVPH